MSVVSQRASEMGLSFPLEVRFAHPDAGYQGTQDHAARFLVPGEVYSVRSLEVGQSDSWLTLAGMPRGEHFSTVLFDAYWPPDDDDEDGELV